MSDYDNLEMLHKISKEKMFNFFKQDNKDLNSNNLIERQKNILKYQEKAHEFTLAVNDYERELERKNLGGFYEKLNKKY